MGLYDEIRSPESRYRSTVFSAWDDVYINIKFSAVYGFGVTSLINLVQGLLFKSQILMNSTDIFLLGVFLFSAAFISWSSANTLKANIRETWSVITDVVGYTVLMIGVVTIVSDRLQGIPISYHPGKALATAAGLSYVIFLLKQQIRAYLVEF